MGIFDKLKTVLFEDEEEEIPVIEKKSQQTSKVVEQVKEPIPVEPRFKNNRVEKVEEKEEVVEEKIEKTVEKPVFQSFDEEEFDRIAAINRNRLLERDRKAREAKEAEKKKLEKQQTQQRVRENVSDMNRRTLHNVSVRDDLPTSNVAKNYGFATRTESVVEQKRFRPSPVISPVYGILDKNYKKEDIIPRASSEGTLPKVMDVDNVRKKALGVLEENIEKEDNIKKFDSGKDGSLTDYVHDAIDSIDDELTKTAEIKIPNLEEHLDEPVIDINDKVTVVNIPEERKKDDDIVLPSRKSENNDTLENDLFNLIDSMYENRDGDK